MKEQIKIKQLSPEERQEIKMQALKYFGANAQFMVCIEELGELIQALAKKARFPESSNENLVEEIADAMITISYLPVIFGISEKEILDAQNAKLIRLQEMIVKNSLNEES